MALIRFAEGQQRSGSIGATVYSHNRFGQYVRARSVPVNPQSSRQQVARNTLRTLMAAWSAALTAAQRAEWTAYADAVSWLNRLGDTVTLTGIAHYLRSNAAILAAGLTRVDDGPAVLALPAGPGTFTVTASEATQQISVAFDNTEDWANEDAGALSVLMGMPQNATRSFFNGPWRWAGVIEGDSSTPPASPAAITAPFTFQEGQRIWCQARVLRADGRVAVPTAVNFLAAA